MARQSYSLTVESYSVLLIAQTVSSCLTHSHRILSPKREGLPMELRSTEEEKQPQPPHFLIVTYPAQGHITPARHLARRLVLAGARVTVCIPVSAFRKMFPAAAEGDGSGSGEDEEREEEGDGVAYASYSDGYDGGFDRAADDHAKYLARVRQEGARTLSALLGRLRDGGPRRRGPVTCAVYTLLMPPWVSRVAAEHGVAHVAVFWIQPATALAAYYHYFRGSRERFLMAAAAREPSGGAEEVRLPGLPPLRLRDLPSFLAITSDDDRFAAVIPEFAALIDAIERDGDPARPAPTYVLANTFDAMELDALASLRPHVEVVTIGPVLSFLHDEADGNNNSPPNDLFGHDGEGGYLSWLDAQRAKSVVYISFGSTSVMSKAQVAEIADAMEQSHRPFLWVLRKDNCRDGEDDEKEAIKELLAAATAAGSVVVEWCDQARVLAHPAVGCFVTHCGWNSTLESVACGVPTVAAPQYSDQGTCAWLVERELGAGVRATARAEDGVLEAGELRRCVEFAMSEAVSAHATAWKKEARAAVADGGVSDRNLREFVSRIAMARCNTE